MRIEEGEYIELQHVDYGSVVKIGLSYYVVSEGCTLKDCINLLNLENGRVIALKDSTLVTPYPNAKVVLE